jgi:hypothetical protein
MIPATASPARASQPSPANLSPANPGFATAGVSARSGSHCAACRVGPAFAKFMRTSHLACETGLATAQACRKNMDQFGRRSRLKGHQRVSTPLARRGQIRSVSRLH